MDRSRRPQKPGTRDAGKPNASSMIGTSLLNEVRDLEKLLKDRDKSIEDLQRERDDMKANVETLQSGLQIEKASVGKLTEENGILKAQLHELRSQMNFKALQGLRWTLTRLLGLVFYLEANQRKSDDFKTDEETAQNDLDHISRVKALVSTVREANMGTSESVLMPVEDLSAAEPPGRYLGAFTSMAIQTLEQNHGMEASQVTYELFLQALSHNFTNKTAVRNFLIRCMRQPGAAFQFRSLVLQNVSKTSDGPVNGGAFADIWKGDHEKQSVAIKVLRAYGGRDKESIKKSICREAVMWYLLDHDNIQPFYGIIEHPEYALITPWRKNGDLSSYLTNNPGAVPPRNMINGIARGLIYLHYQDLIHGDLRGENVLVDDFGRPCITDFGLARVAEAYTGAATTSREDKGSLRFQAPELLMPEEFKAPYNSPKTTKESDVYAFAMTCVQVYTGQKPMAEFNDGNVLIKIMAGSRPVRPQASNKDHASPAIEDEVWDTMQRCWQVQPQDRPTMEMVEHQIHFKEDERLLPNTVARPQKTRKWSLFNRSSLGR